MIFFSYLGGEVLGPVRRGPFLSVFRAGQLSLGQVDAAGLDSIFVFLEFHDDTFLILTGRIGTEFFFWFTPLALFFFFNELVRFHFLFRRCSVGAEVVENDT